MNRLRFFAAVAAFFALPVAAAADPSFECSITSSSQVETRQCLADAEATVNKTVEAALGFAMEAAKELDQVTGRDLGVEALQAAQEAWLAYRDRHCAFVGTTFGGGSGTGIAILSCRVALGRARVEELMTYVR